MLTIAVEEHDSVFHAEEAFADRAHAIGNDPALGSEDLRREYKHLAKQYSVLLREVLKITRIGDATQIELRRLKQELSLALTESEQLRKISDIASRMKTEILSIAAHDLKNPLGTILGMISLLELGEHTLEGSIPITSIMRTTAESMIELIGHLLDSSAMDLGTMNVNKGLCNAFGAMERVVLDNGLRAEQKQQTLSFTYDGENFDLFADQRLVHQVFDNLVSNAVKYSPPHTTITTRITALPHSIRVEVRDEGPGLTDDDKQRMFGYFQRLSARPTADESSHGVGLAVVKRIVELHEGTIEVRSVFGEGATFIVEFPAHHDRLARMITAEMSSAPMWNADRTVVEH
jgi:signal transduction histidine kinase